MLINFAEEITDKNPELGKLRMIHFAKTYDPIRAKKTKEDDDIISDENESQAGDREGSDQWRDDEDRVANFYITGDPNYDFIPLPKIIKLKNCADGK